jgi:hypothetical protein
MQPTILNPIGALTKWSQALVCDSRFGIATKTGRLERGSRPQPKGMNHPQGYSEAPSLTH